MEEFDLREKIIEEIYAKELFKINLLLEDPSIDTSCRNVDYNGFSHTFRLFSTQI